MRLVTLALAASLLPAASAACAASAATKDFVEKAALGGLFEIQMGRLAQGRTDNIDISRFAQRMISEHGDANNALKMTAKAGAPDVELPAVLDAARKAKIDAMSKMKGEDFDAAFVTSQSEAHFEAVKLFTDYAEAGDQPELKKYAADTLPVLKAHQDALAHLGAR
jgi:putative membrane protein